MPVRPSLIMSWMRAANTGDLQCGAMPVSFSYHLKAGISQLLPNMRPDWDAGVEEGTPQRHRCNL